MPISAAGNRKTTRSDGGFTLVELMVVIVVIALASAAAMWAMPDPRGRVLDEATRFAARVKAARDAAIVGGRPVSLWVTPGGYGFDARLAGQWVPIPDKPLRIERWSDGTKALLPADRRVRVTFDTTGLADRSIEVRLDRGGPGARVVIGGDGAARVVAR